MANGGYYTVFNAASERSKKLLTAEPIVVRSKIASFEQFKKLMETAAAEKRDGKRLLSTEERGELLFQQHCKEVYLFMVRAISEEASSSLPLPQTSYKFRQLMADSMLSPPLPFELPDLPGFIAGRGAKKDPSLWSLNLMGREAVPFLQKYAEQVRSIAGGVNNILARSTLQSSHPIFPDNDFFVVAESHYALHIVFSEFLKSCSLLACDPKEGRKVFLPPPSYQRLKAESI